MFQGLRYAIASIIVGVYTYKDIKKTTWQSFKQGSILGLFLGLGFAFQTVGLKITTASKSGFITGLIVVFTPIFQLIIEKRKPTKGNLIGVVLVAIGLYFLTSPQGSAMNIGDILTLGCAIVFAMYMIYLDIFTKKNFYREIVFYQMLVTSLFGFLAAPLVESSYLNFNQVIVFAILYTAVFASAIASFLQSKYQRQTTPTRAAVIMSMEPVFAVVLAVLILHEVLAPFAVLGGGLIIAGLLVSELA